MIGTKNKFSLITQVRIISLVSLTVLVVGLTFTSYLSQRWLLREFEHNREKPVQDARLITWKMDVHLERLEQELLRLARVEDLKDALSKMDRGELLEQARPPLNRLRKTPLRVERISFYLPSGTAFLRAHNSDSYGDDVSGHRSLVAEAGKNRRVLRGVEPEGNTFFLWAVTPLYDKGRFIGTMEMGSPMSFFLQEVKNQLGTEVGLFTQSRASSATLVPVDATEAELVGSVARLLDFSRMVTAPNREVVTVAGRTYAVSLVPIKDFSLHQGLVLAVLFDVTRFTQLLTRNTTSLIAVSACGFVIAAILIIFLTRRLEKVRRSLEDRTAQLAAAQERELREAEVLRERSRTEEEIRRNLQRIQALREIDIAITSSLDLHDVLSVLLEKIDLFLPYSTATIRLYSNDSGLLEPVACRNLDEKEWKLEQWKPGRGPANEVFESKAPMMIRNCCTDPRVRDQSFFRKHGLVSYMGVPLVAKEEFLGVLSFYTKEEHEFTSEEIEFLSTLAGQAAVAIHNSQLYEETRTREGQLQKTNRMLSALHDVAAAASESLGLDRVFEAAIEKVTNVFHFDATRIHSYDKRTDGLVLRASFNNDPDRFTEARSFKRGQGIVGTAAERGAPLIFEDVETDPLYRQLSRTNVARQFGYHFFAVFPIRGKRANLGTLGCVGAAPRKLSSSEIQLLEAIADRIGVAIENSELYEQLKEKVQELQQKATELEVANKGKDEFLSVMSHELRTPLNVISGYTQIMKQKILGEITAEQEVALGKIMRQSIDLLSMINGVLQVTRIEAEAVTAETREVNLGHFLDELKSSYDFPLDKELTLNWDYPSELPVVKTDDEKLKHVLQNLVNNAIKFTEKGNVTISARHLPELMAVQFRVVDTGIGIPKTSLPIIFERFRQVDSSETRTHGGVGIGLYLVKKFTEILGGHVEVESELGKGSRFVVSLPVGAEMDVRSLH